MAAFLPQHEDIFHKLLNYSDSKGKFEGYDSSNYDVQQPEHSFDFLMENWLCYPIELKFTSALGVLSNLYQDYL